MFVYHQGEHAFQSFKLNIVPLVLDVIDYEFDSFEVPEGLSLRVNKLERLCIATAAILMKSTTFTYLSKQEFSNPDVRDTLIRSWITVMTR